ncbi:MAG: tRNA pseudouridine(38-40) synthase TruA [SAR86 cluster bacterium]|uniref:tRNA pseudouridine synthase A n=1 Tax=SAR86 cluster bacterium TaxID=2030880 RepID=A0A2A5BC13_9GAMM|nr:MAG: tRNA pseudouridine(38-40) synthase TruA [SAR86 cluster bacterium]
MSDPKLPPKTGCRIALGVEYDGANYSGWQKQLSPEQNTIQQNVERALSKVADTEVSVTCAGRTDSGVHATSQVIHFDCVIDRGLKAWVVGCNSLLPKTIRILWAKNVADDFHARFSARSRRYLYLIYQRKIESTMFVKRVTHERGSLNIEQMHEAAQCLLGEQDFTSFRAAGCQSRTAKRNVMHAKVYKSGQLIVFDIQANAFLQHMVRNIMGSLIKVGKGEQQAQWIAQLLKAKDRSLSAATALPHGLYLTGVDYPEEFKLPSDFLIPDFLQGGT